MLTSLPRMVHLFLGAFVWRWWFLLCRSGPAIYLWQCCWFLFCFAFLWHVWALSLPDLNQQETATTQLLFLNSGWCACSSLRRLPFCQRMCWIGVLFLLKMILLPYILSEWVCEILGCWFLNSVTMLSRAEILCGKLWSLCWRYIEIWISMLRQNMIAVLIYWTLSP